MDRREFAFELTSGCLSTLPDSGLERSSLAENKTGNRYTADKRFEQQMLVDTLVVFVCLLNIGGYVF